MTDRLPPVPIFYFTKVKNVGDAINPWLISRLFGRDAILSSQRHEHLLGIGSLMGVANQHSRIWGTGVLHPSAISADIAPENIYAVRGKLSVAAMKAHGIRMPDVPLGDPAFLVGRIAAAAPRVTKKYRLGLAAHYVDRSHPLVRTALARPDMADLNVHADPDVFLATLAACETVASSSLHGLVFAEALGIPNVWIELSDKVLGDGFKFRDWFSLAEKPQDQPEIPATIDELFGLAEKATLHGMQIDVDNLVKQFPPLRARS